MANSLQLWRPVHEMENLRHDFELFFERFFGARPQWPQAFLTEPAIDSFIEGDKLMVRAQLPGVDPKDVDASISGNVLTIRASREEKSEQKDRDFLRHEISYGKIERSISLPPGTTGEGVKASCHDGVLELTIPVPKELSSHKINIEHGNGGTGTHRREEKKA